MTRLIAKSAAMREAVRLAERLGGRRTIRVDARVVALTNADLEDAVRRRAFRPDLFYRLNVVHIRVPPLRDRPEDINPLARVSLKTFARKHGRPASRLDREAAAVLASYESPGNVRELSHVLERAVVVSDGGRLAADDLPAPLRASAAGAARGGGGRRSRRSRPTTSPKLCAPRAATSRRRRACSASAARASTRGWRGRGK